MGAFDPGGPSGSLGSSSTSKLISSHRAQPSTASTSSYAPVLINPDISGRITPSSDADPGQAVQLTLRYPYPLPLASLLDLAYTLHHQSAFLSLLAHRQPADDGDKGQGGDTPTALLLTAAAARAVVLIVVVGWSRRWRSRGGWVAAVCGLSVGAGIWEDCAERLGAGGGRRGGGKGQSWFLYMTILICFSEYLLYLALLRLSPPSHRPRPFSLRLPSAQRQRSVPFAFHSEELEYSPKSAKRRWSSSRSTKGRLFPLREGDGGGEAGASGWASGTRGHHPPEDDEDEDEGEDDDDDTDDRNRPYRRSYSHSSSHSDLSTFTADAALSTSSHSPSSSISSNSIIDLPPPLSPNRIIPPSLSVNSGLTLAMGAQPILGGIVRRSGSARFLGRSWGSGVVLGSPRDQGRGKRNGDGTGEERGWMERSRERAGEGRAGKGRQGNEEGPEGEASGSGYGTFQA